LQRRSPTSNGSPNPDRIHLRPGTVDTSKHAAPDGVAATRGFGAVNVSDLNSPPVQSEDIGDSEASGVQLFRALAGPHLVLDFPVVVRSISHQRMRFDDQPVTGPVEHPEDQALDPPFGFISIELGQRTNIV